MDTPPKNNGAEKRVLLTSLSPTPRDAVYFLGGKTAGANQSPLALLQLLPPERLPREIIVLCTEKLKEQYGRVSEIINSGNFSCGQPGKQIKVTQIPIPDGKTVEETWQILHLILEAVPPGCRLTLDLTHGYRSFPFLFFTAALYLKALRSVHIEAAYYAMFEAIGEEKPLVDLSVILDLVEWFYAVRTFRETGQAGMLVSRLAVIEECLAGLQGEARRPYSQVRGLRESLETVAAAYIQALPLEFGLASAGLLNKLKLPLPEPLQEKTPLPGELFGEIGSFIEPFALSGCGRDKKKVPLEERELARQAGIIDACLRQGHVNHATGLIREWMVSAAMFRQSGLERVEGKEWLNYNGRGGRRLVEGRLNLLAKALSGKLPGARLTEAQAWLAGQWQFLADRRNGLHHHGFKPDNALLDDRKLREIRERWTEIKISLNDTEKWRLDLVPEKPGGPDGYGPAGGRPLGEKPPGGGSGTLLVSPLGLSRGLLYSALHHIRPEVLFVISSPDAAACLDEIMEKAGWGGNRMVRLMRDPHAGFDEVESFAKDVTPAVMQADEVVVNITGGTTAMQHIVQQVAAFAADLGRPVRRAALVDRRPPQEQRDDPYVPGELIWLDRERRE